jgi:hypothetical protein
VEPKIFSNELDDSYEAAKRSFETDGDLPVRILRSLCLRQMCKSKSHKENQAVENFSSSGDIEYTTSFEGPHLASFIASTLSSMRWRHSHYLF